MMMTTTMRSLRGGSHPGVRILDEMIGATHDAQHPKWVATVQMLHRLDAERDVGMMTMMTATIVGAETTEDIVLVVVVEIHANHAHKTTILITATIELEGVTQETDVQRIILVKATEKMIATATTTKDVEKLTTAALLLNQRNLAVLPVSPG